MAIAHRKGRKRPGQPHRAGRLPRTSSDPGRPLGLVITPGTPVVDFENEVFGRVAAVTPEYCVMRPDRGSAAYCVCRWRHAAVGHVRPAKAALPRRVVEHARLNYCATLLAELEGLRGVAGLTPALQAARRDVLATLRRGG